DGDTKGLDELVNTPKLWPHVIGQGRSMCFIFGELLVPKGRCRPIKGHRHILGLLFGEGFHKHRCEAKSGIDRFTATTCKLFWYCVKGAVNHGVSIDQYQFFALRFGSALYSRSEER